MTRSGQAKHRSEELPILLTKDERRRFYDKIAPYYDVLAEPSEQPIRETALGMLSPAPGERILEIGFATGRLLSRIAESVGEQGRVYGIDISDKMLCRTKLALEAKRLESRVELHGGDAASLPYVDDSMDAVILCFTLELFDTSEIPRVLAECRRVLRRDGRIIVAALSKDGKPKVVARAFDWTHQHFPNLMDCRPIHLQQLLVEAGFIIGSSHLDHTWMPVEIVLAHNPTAEQCDDSQRNLIQRTAIDQSTEHDGPYAASLTREQVHELRNRLYASSLALRAICRMIDDGKSAAARTAAQTMLDKLNDELHDIIPP